MHLKLHACLNTTLISFWTLWLSIVLASDCCDLFIYYGWLAADWPFTSNNLSAVFRMGSRDHLSPPPIISLFWIIILWCLGNLGLFLKAFYHFKERQKFLILSGWAYFFLIGLQLCFNLADELFIFYDFTDGLMARISLMILCYGCVLVETIRFGKTAKT